MSEKTIEVTSELKAIAEATSSEKFRPKLRNVQVKNGRATATDGFILATMEVGCEDTLIPKELIQKPKLNKIFPTSIEIGAEELTLNEVGVKTIMAKPGVNELEDFPTTEKILNTSRENKHYTLGLGVEVLEKLVRVMKKSKQTVVVIKLPEDNMKPIYCKTAKGIEIVLMPYIVPEGHE